jgi:hypothetical protein
VNVLKGIVEGKDYSDKIEKIDEITRKTIRVKSFQGKDSEELKYDKDFETYCIILSKYTNKHVKELTTKEYFSLRKFADDENKRNKKKK